jgi:hypothetical protein
VCSPVFRARCSFFVDCAQALKRLKVGSVCNCLRHVKTALASGVILGLWRLVKEFALARTVSGSFPAFEASNAVN